jgi:hypothetical protein
MFVGWTSWRRENDGCGGAMCREKNEVYGGYCCYCCCCCILLVQNGRAETRLHCNEIMNEKTKLETGGCQDSEKSKILFCFLFSFESKY